MNEFMFWCRNPLVPLLFHEVTSLHPPSFQKNDFSTCNSLLWLCSYVSLVLDNDNIMEYLEEHIMEYLEEMNQTLHQRLESLEDNLRQSCKTGDFLNPAHNCSHILHYYPQATSGKIAVNLHSF